MAAMTTLLSDVGGVLLTNAWGRPERQRAVERFRLDADEFSERHELVTAAFEKGQLRLPEYLDRTVFYRPRDFTRQEFQDFMFAQSEAHPESLALMDRLARTRNYLMATLNNESFELNLYRINHFDLRAYFSIFFSSCFLGVKKPEEAIYRLALEITQRAPEECVFVDDRPLNLECARALGIRTVLFESPSQLERDLRALGMVVP